MAWLTALLLSSVLLMATLLSLILRFKKWLPLERLWPPISTDFLGWVMFPDSRAAKPHTDSYKTTPRILSG